VRFGFVPDAPILGNREAAVVVVGDAGSVLVATLIDQATTGGSS
jgi:hypothetical protein